jgi:hypothetical protein
VRWTRLSVFTKIGSKGVQFHGVTSVNNIHTAVREIIGEEPRRVACLGSGNNDVLRVETSSTSYVLKCFERDQHRAYGGEIGMRECLRCFTRIAFPTIVGCAELGENRYVLMRHVEGERLGEIWSKYRTQASTSSWWF